MFVRLTARIIIRHSKKHFYEEKGIKYDDEQIPWTNFFLLRNM